MKLIFFIQSAHHFICFKDSVLSAIVTYSRFEKGFPTEGL